MQRGIAEGEQERIGPRGDNLALQVCPASPQPLQTFHQIDRAGQNGCPKITCFFEPLANRPNGELRRIQPVLHFFPPQRG